jgi:hypothetical protein
MQRFEFVRQAEKCNQIQDLRHRALAAFLAIALRLLAVRDLPRDAPPLRPIAAK